MKAPQDMNSQAATTSSGSTTSTADNQNQRDSRLTVADILSSMANGEVVTPTTFATMEGFSTGIPTRTTPTLTPTTLRNIEQTFIELQSVPPPLHHQHQAGFVPPIVHTNGRAPTPNPNYPLKEEPMWYSPTQHNTGCSSMSGRLSSSSASSTSSTNTVPPTKTKGSGRMGGRRPKRDEKNLSPEEEERRRVRRERNKLAAARCRKRRLDHTNVLLEETEGLEDKKQGLQKEIHELQNQKEQLEFILEAHRCICKSRKLAGGGNGATNNSNRSLNPLKDSNLSEANANFATPTTVPTTTYATDSNYPSLKPPTRPTSLSISQSFTVPSSSHSSTSLRLNTSVSVTEVAGIPITTPSEGMFNFAALMEGGTGLTPVSTGLTPVVPTCSSQQRSSSSDLSSPDTMNGPKLVSL